MRRPREWPPKARAREERHGAGDAVDGPHSRILVRDSIWDEHGILGVQQRIFLEAATCREEANLLGEYVRANWEGGIGAVFDDDPDEVAAYHGGELGVEVEVAFVADSLVHDVYWYCEFVLRDGEGDLLPQTITLMSWSELGSGIGKVERAIGFPFSMRTSAF